MGTWSLTGFPLGPLVGAAVQRTIPGMPGGDPPTWAALGNVDGLAAALTNVGLADVEVTVVSHGWRFADPEAFFREAPTWSPPLQPLFEVLDEEQVAAAAGHFADVVAEASGPDGITHDALIAVGHVR